MSLHILKLITRTSDRKLPFLFMVTIGLTACGGGGGGGSDASSLPEGATVSTPEFETYKNSHNSYDRVRLLKAAGDTDTAVLAQFDSTGSGPDNFKNLIALTDSAYTNAMTIEVIAETNEDGTPKRLLRLTADETPFTNTSGNTLVTATGTYYFRGENYAWVQIGDGGLLSGNQKAAGLVNLALNFDTGTASINLVTGVNAETGSEVRTEVVGTDMPFNIVSGAYGGAVTVQVWNPDSSDIYGLSGTLRGNVGGSPTYSDGQHNMTTSGLYTASGTSEGTSVSVDGVYYGKDPNAF